MTTYNLGVRLETFHNVDAKNLKDAFKKVKESWKQMHDIELNDYDITAYKEVVRVSERLSKGNVPYRQFDEIKPLTNKRVWHTEGKEFLTVVEDYGNGELLFSNGVLGRDEDCNYGKLPKEET
jgi:hypothetical protein